MLAPWMAGAVMAVLAPQAIAAPPPCKAVAVDFDRGGGSFDGMSQSGVLLIVRNVGSAACLMPGLPTLQFDDAADHALLREPPPGMHPGPVITPLVLVPGGAASAPLHWVSADVYVGHHCLSPSKIVSATARMRRRCRGGSDRSAESPGSPSRFANPCCGPGLSHPHREFSVTVSEHLLHAQHGTVERRRDVAKKRN